MGRLPSRNPFSHADHQRHLPLPTPAGTTALTFTTPPHPDD